VPSGAAENSLQAYGSDLVDYVAFLGTRGVALLSASSDDIRAYLGSLEKQGLPDDCGPAASAVRQFHQLFMARSCNGKYRSHRKKPQGRPLPKSSPSGHWPLLAKGTFHGQKARHSQKAERLHCLLELLAATGSRFRTGGATVRGDVR
jgi:integrase/recombinase XerD